MECQQGHYCCLHWDMHPADLLNDQASSAMHGTPAGAWLLDAPERDGLTHRVFASCWCMQLDMYACLTHRVFASCWCMQLDMNACLTHRVFASCWCMQLDMHACSWTCMHAADVLTHRDTTAVGSACT